MIVNITVRISPSCVEVVSPTGMRHFCSTEDATESILEIVRDEDRRGNEVEIVYRE